MLRYWSVSVIHQTLTWTAGSLTCIGHLFACVYTRGTSVYSRTEFDSGEISGSVESLAHNCRASLCHANAAQLTEHSLLSGAGCIFFRWVY